MEICRVALVDDNSIFCFIFEKLVEKYERKKIDVMKFDNGQSALDYFLAHRNEKENLPEVVFVDINMPILNGWQLLEALVVNQHPILENTPFFIVSSSDNNLDISKAKEYPFIREYLHKPLDKQKLFAILDQYL